MYVQKNNPFKVTSCGRRRTFMQDGGKSPLKKGNEPRKTIGPGKNFNKANPTGTGAAAGGGMTQKKTSSGNIICYFVVLPELRNYFKTISNASEGYDNHLPLRNP